MAGKLQWRSSSGVEAGDVSSGSVINGWVAEIEIFSDELDEKVVAHQCIAASVYELRKAVVRMIPVEDFQDFAAKHKAFLDDPGESTLTVKIYQGTLIIRHVELVRKATWVPVGHRVLAVRNRGPHN